MKRLEEIGKRFLAVILAALLLVGSVPIGSVKAEGTEDASFGFVQTSGAGTHEVTYVEGLQIQFHAESSVPGEKTVSYTSSDFSIAEVNPVTGLVSIHKAGDVTITATQGAFTSLDDPSTSYTETVRTCSLKINKAKQTGFAITNGEDAQDTITFDPEHNTYEINLASDDLKGIITYEVEEADQAIADFADSSNGELTINKPGTVHVKVVLTPQGSDAECYEEEEKDFTLTIEGMEQDELAFDIPEPEEFAFKAGESNTFTNVASGGSGDGEITYKIVDMAEENPIASVDINGVVTINGTGSVTVRATKAASGNYREQTKEYELVIKQAQDTLEWNDELAQNPNQTIKYNLNSENQIPLSVEGGSTGEAVTYEIVNQPENEEDWVAEIDGGTGELHILKAGSVVVKATMAGDDSYAAVSTTERTIVIEKAEQLITFGETSSETNRIEVPYGAAFASQAVEETVADVEDGKGYGTGSIVYQITEGTDIVSAVDAETGALTFVTGKTGNVTVKAYKEADDCYAESDAVYCYIKVSNVELPEVPYTITGEKKVEDSDWYTSNVVIYPASGYLISETEILGTEEGWQESITYSDDGQYENKSVYLRNVATGGVTEEVLIQETQNGNAICIDKTKPERLTVSYAPSESVAERIIGVITFRFYKGSVDVTLRAEDTMSGIESLTYYKDEADEGTTILAEDPEMTVDGNSVSYSFRIPEETVNDFEGKISFKVKDKAGNESSYLDDEGLVVDNTAPELLSVAYSDYSTATEISSLDKITAYRSGTRTDVNLFYSDDAQVTFCIKEKYFYAEDVVIEDNGENCASLVRWSEGEGANEHIGTLTLSDDGDHVIMLSYTDPSGNEMDCTSVDSANVSDNCYTTEHLIIDSGQPVIAADFPDNRKEKDGIIYLDEDGNVTLNITEKYFSSKSVDIAVAAVDAEGNSISVTIDGESYIDYLANPANWQQNGEMWTAVVPCDEEATYAWTINYEDFAGRKAEEKKYLLVLDKQAPAVGNVSYADTYKQVLDAQGNVLTDETAWEAGRWLYADAVNVAIPITEANFYQEDVDVKIYRDGVLLENGDGCQYDVTGWQTDSAVKTKHWLSVKLGTDNEHGAKDGIYQIQIAYTDRAGNVMGTFLSRKIEIDTVQPEVSIAYDNLQVMNGQYYYQQKAIVTVEDCHTDLENCRISLIGCDSQGRIVLEKTEEDFEWVAQDTAGQYTCIVDCNSSAAYTLVVTGTDYAGNTRQIQKSFIVDNIAPKAVDLPYDTAYTGSITRIVDENNTTVETADASSRFIYSDEAGFLFQLVEANFRAADAIVTVTRDGEKLANGDGYQYDAGTAWSSVEDTHTLKLSIGKKNKALIDGNYRVTVSYVDLAGNTMKTYTSNVMTIDTTLPEVSISYDNNTVKNKYYYNAERTATITVTDKNIVPDEIEIQVTATDVEGNTVSYATDKRLSSWKQIKGTDDWTATLKFDVDANYAIAISVPDMAEHVVTKKDSFTVDKKKSDVATLRCEYSESVL
ncbi:MAG: Ig-like domain-containing protein, partial [Roseburia sp.]